MLTSTRSRGRLIVVGGSVGGLFAANMLIRQGWDVDVYERTTGRLSRRGAGIAGHPELAPILRACGIAADRLPGVDVAGRTAFDAAGRLIAYFPYPQYLTYWGLLHERLLGVFPAAHYHQGIEVLDIGTDGDEAWVRLADGRVERGALVVAADGIRSTVRAHLAPQAQPAYAGYFAFRGAVCEGHLSEEFRRDVSHRYVWLFCGDGQINGYPIGGHEDGSQPRQRRYVYLWYKRADVEEMQDLLTDADGQLHASGIPPPLVRPEHFARLKRHAAEIVPAPFAEIITSARSEILQPIYDVASPRMVFGNVALLGDAAFTARPHIGTGVLKAGQDALALSGCLAQTDDVPAALAAYEAERAIAGRRAVTFSRHLGSYIEQGLPLPESDPALMLSPGYLISVSARAIEACAPLIEERRALLDW